MKPLPSLELLQSELSYDSDTGVFMWRKPKQGRAANLVAGYQNRGYLRIHVDGVTYLAHRLAFLMHYGRAPIGEIDHIDGDPSNNAISNLREATRLENSRNRRSSAGVSRHKLRIKNPFQARIKHNGKARSIGVFPTFEAAREAYEREANKHFGEFSPARILGGRDRT